MSVGWAVILQFFVKINDRESAKRGDMMCHFTGLVFSPLRHRDAFHTFSLGGRGGGGGVPQFSIFDLEFGRDSFAFLRVCTAVRH